MIEFTHSEISAFYSSRVPALRQMNSKQWRGKCPVHDGDGENFAVDAETGGSFCHSQCGKGWDIIGLEMELGRTDFIQAKKEVFRLIGRPEPKWEDRDVIATYDYTDEHGNLLYQVLRKFPKDFRQRRPDSTGKWIYSLKDQPRVPFQLAKFHEHEAIAVCEGEKDAINLTRIGVFATCNSEGALKWRPELTPYFAEKQIIIFPDNDQKGREHALLVAESLYPVAKRIRIAEIPGLAAKGDVSDFIQAGGTIQQLRQCVKAAHEYRPGWTFPQEIPSEEDHWVKTSAQIVACYDSPESFWDLAAQQGIPTPFATLNDDLGGGLRNGEVYIIAAERGFGKSSLALQFLIKASKLGYGGLLFSLEMGEQDVLRRMVSIEERIDLAQLRILQRKEKEHANTIPDQALLKKLTRRLVARTKQCSEYKILVHQKPRVTPQYLIEEVQRLSVRQKLDYIILDHMQLMGSTGQEKKDYEKFTAISRALKGEVARELQVPVLVVSQVSRTNSIEKRTELEITDMRGSGAIEEDAAAVMLAYHDAEHVKELKAMGGSALAKGPVRSWLKLGKSRFGSSGTYLPLQHFKSCTRFDSEDPRDYEPESPMQSELGATA